MPYPAFLTDENADITECMEAVREHLSHLITVDEETIKDLWEARKYIELGICLSAMHKATNEDLYRLDKFIKQMEACGKDIRSYFPIAVDFH
jgi:DNA-binding FadR family transcriptional regulator